MTDFGDEKMKLDSKYTNGVIFSVFDKKSLLFK